MAQRYSLLVAVAIALGGVAVMFQPVTVGDLKGAQFRLRERFGHQELVQVQCGSWAVRRNRHSPLCPFRIREQRILGYAIGIGALGVAIAGSVVFRGRASRRKAVAFAGFVVAVGGILMLFRPLVVEHFRDQPAFRGSAFVTSERRCGSVVFRPPYTSSRPPLCRDTYVAHSAFAGAVIGSGAIFAFAGVALLGRRSPQLGNEDRT